MWKRTHSKCGVRALDEGGDADSDADMDGPASVQGKRGEERRAGREGQRRDAGRGVQTHEGTRRDTERRRDGAGARGAEPWFARGGACALPAGRGRVSPGLAALRTGQREHSGLELRPWQ